MTVEVSAPLWRRIVVYLRSVAALVAFALVLWTTAKAFSADVTLLRAGYSRPTAQRPPNVPAAAQGFAALIRKTIPATDRIRLIPPNGDCEAQGESSFWLAFQIQPRFLTCDLDARWSVYFLIAPYETGEEGRIIRYSHDMVIVDAHPSARG